MRLQERLSIFKGEEATLFVGVRTYCGSLGPISRLSADTRFEMFAGFARNGTFNHCDAT